MNFGKKEKKKEEKRNIEVSKIFNFGNLKTDTSKTALNVNYKTWINLLDIILFG